MYIDIFNYVVRSLLKKKMYCIKVDIQNKKTILTEEKIPHRESDTDVIVKVAYAGFCGTDLHIIHGEFDAKDGITLGHEIVGTVADISTRYSHLLVVGDRVSVNPNMACGICTPCKRNKTNFCVEGSLKNTIGIASNGGWAEYVRVHVSLLAKVPDAVSMKQALLCEPLSCVIHGLDKLPDLEMGSSVLIIGAGIIGFLWSCLLHVMGHRKVTVFEPNPNRRAILSKAGLGYKCTTQQEMLRESPNFKVDICVDCSGNSEAMQAAIPLVENGGTFLIFGVANPEKIITINPYKLFFNEITVLGVNINTPNSFERAMSFLESMAKTHLVIEHLEFKTFPLNEHDNALKAFQSGSFTKVLFNMFS